MTPESQSQKTLQVKIKPDSFGAMAPGDNNRTVPDPPKLTVTNNEAFPRYFHVDFFLKGKKADWFDEIQNYPVDSGSSDPDPKPIYVEVPKDFARALAGTYDVEIRVTDLDTAGRPHDSATMKLFVQRVGDYSVSVKPGEMTDSTALFTLSVTNNANAPLKVRLKDAPPTAPFTFSATPPDMEVKPTETLPLAVTVRLKDNQSLPAGHTIDLVTEGKYQLVDVVDGGTEPASENTQQVTWPRPPFSIISVAPPSLSLVPGEKAELTLTLTNEGRDTQQISLSVEGIPEGWVTQTTPSQLDLPPGSSATAKLAISVPKDALAGDYPPFRVRAASRNAQAQAEVPMAVQLSEVQTTVTVYEHPNFQGASAALGTGRYDLDDLLKLGIRNDNLDSLRVPRGMRATLYQHAHFKGESKVFDQDASYVGDDFRDKTSSIVIDHVVWVYEHPNFQGASAALGIDRYDLDDLLKLGICNDNLDSLRVPRGMRATLYQHAHFKGESKVFDQDASYVGDDFRDKTSSIVIDQP